MPQNFFITNSENQNNASTLAQYSGGAVLVLSTSVLESDSGTVSKSEESVRTTTKNENIWTLKIAEWYTDRNLTYSDSRIEDILARTGAFHLLYPGLYAVSFPESVSFQDEKAVLSYIKDVLDKRGNFTMVVGSSNGSKTVNGN